MPATSDSASVQSSSASRQQSTLSTVTDAQKSQRTSGKVRAAAARFKQKLTFRSHKLQDEPQLASSEAIVRPDLPGPELTGPVPSVPLLPAPTDDAASGHLNTENLQTPAQWLPYRDIFVQVLHASHLRGADVSGSSDPFCKVSLGHFQAHTRTLSRTLDPAWNETFTFVLEPDALALMGGAPVITFEVWDYNRYARNYFLGETSWQLPSEVQQSKVTQQLSLHSNRHKARAQSTGFIEFAVWLGPTGDVLGRMCEGKSSCVRTKLSSLVRPFGHAKTLPLVVHTSGNTVYEEPCLAYLHLHITQVKGLQTDLVPQRSAISRARTLRRSNSSSKMSSPSHSRLARVLHRSQHSTPGAMQRHQMLSPADSEEIQETLMNAPSESNVAPGEGDSPRSLESGGGGDSQPSPFRQWAQGQQPWWAKDDQESSFLDRSDRAESEPDTDPGSTSPDGLQHSHSARRRYFYLMVAMGSQKHTSILKHADEAGSLQWDWKVPLVAQVPIANRIVKMELHSTSSRSKVGKVIARALIPLFQLIGFHEETEAQGPGRRRAEEGQWFRLHGPSRAASLQEAAGIAKLAMAVVDADVRRTMYLQPLLSQDKYTGDVPQYEKQAWQAEASGIAQPSLLQLTPLPEHLNEEPQRSSHEGVMNWLHDGPAVQHTDSFGREASHSDAGVHTPISPSGSSQHQQWPAFPSPPYIPQQTSSQQHSLMQAATRHARAAAAAGQQLAQEAVRWAKGLPVQHTGPSVQPGVNVPAGMLKVTLHDVELSTPSLCFCVIKVGPHWGRTATVMAAPTVSWNWEVHVPLYDPSTVMLLAVCVAQPKVHRARIVTRAVRSMLAQEDTVLGKLRIRLSTLQPWTEVEARLPMLADRDKGCAKVAHAHLSLKVLHWNQRVLLTEYVKPHFPSGVYKYDLHHGSAAHKVGHEHDRIVATWLEGVNPPLPTSIALGVVDTQRWRFTMSRARTNWQRLQNVRTHVARYQAGFESLQRWEYPVVSMAAIVGTTLLSFYPHAVLACLLLYTMLHSLLIYRGVYKGQPLEMEAEAEAEEKEEETELLSDTNAVAQLRRKYNRLLGVALTLQNLLDDIATQLERLHACITWQDPSATLLFIAFCAAAAMALAMLGLPSVMAFGCFWMLRPPQLRTPTPAPPVAFFKRLPSVTDQLI